MKLITLIYSGQKIEFDNIEEFELWTKHNLISETKKTFLLFIGERFIDGTGIRKRLTIPESTMIINSIMLLEDIVRTLGMCCIEIKSFDRDDYCEIVSYLHYVYHVKY